MGPRLGKGTQCGGGSCDKLAYCANLPIFPWLGSKGARQQAIPQAASHYKNMDQAKVIEIQEAAMQAAKDVVRAQIAKGAPDKGMSKARHAAVVADVTQEMLASFAEPGDSKSMRLIMRAAFSGSLLNASQLRQQLEKAGVLKPEGAISSEYGID